LASICREFGIEPDERNSFGWLDMLNLFLLEQHAAGRTVVLVVDEAQNLAPDVLEQVRMISNLETKRDKLIQIVLAGQPELNDVLGRHDLRQLNQRITVRCSLTPMGRRDTAEYIKHRLKVSGCRIPGLFSSGAVKRIYRFSRGVPRLVNIVCEQALVMAWTQENSRVTPAIAARVIAEAEHRTGRRGIWQRIHGWLWAGR
jgi:general secretion pathway protein A